MCFQFKIYRVVLTARGGRGRGRGGVRAADGVPAGAGLPARGRGSQRRAAIAASSGVLVFFNSFYESTLLWPLNSSYVCIYLNSDPALLLVREDRVKALKTVRALPASFRLELESRKFKKQVARILLPTAPARKTKQK